MFLANLTLAQFLGIFGAVAAGVVALYLLDRSRRRQVVASLRFWKRAATPVESRRWRVREPISLLLQLLGIALLLLAVAQLRVGSPENSSRDHVLVLDVSAWMGAMTPEGSLMEKARARALAYVRAVPASDRIMVMRAGALITPVTSFEAHRQEIEEAINTTEPGFGAVDLREALRLAERVRSLNARRPGEIVCVSAGRTAGGGGDVPFRDITGFRYLPIEGAIENVGLRRVGLRHAPDDPTRWDIFVAVKNDTPEARTVEVGVQFASSPAAYRTIKLAPEGAEEFIFPLRTRAAGILEVRLFSDDDFPADNVVRLEVPSHRPVRIRVLTLQPDRWRPLLSASPMVDARFERPGSVVPPDADIVILDRCGEPAGNAADTIWVLPPADAAPVKVERVRDAQIDYWNIEHPLTKGLRTVDLKLAEALLLDPSASDTVIGESKGRAVALARTETGDRNRRVLILGFGPGSAEMKYRLAAPLLFANAIRWLRPEVFRQWELNSGSVGTISMDLSTEAESGTVEVLSEDGEQLPFSLNGHHLRFYAGHPGTVRVISGDQEAVWSLHLPAIPDTQWKPPESALTGIPENTEAAAGAVDLWAWLALAGGLILMGEWQKYGRTPRAGRPLEAERSGR